MMNICLITMEGEDRDITVCLKMHKLRSKEIQSPDCALIDTKKIISPIF